MENTFEAEVHARGHRLHVRYAVHTTFITIEEVLTSLIDHNGYPVMVDTREVLGIEQVVPEEWAAIGPHAGVVQYIQSRVR